MIIQAKENEYKTLTEIWEDSVRATHTFLNESDINFFRPKILNEYLYAVKLYVYKDKFENILGFIGIDENKVEMLFIEPKYFKNGIGKKLLEFAITTYNIDEVDVNEQNPNAVNFYKYMGFEVINKSETDCFGKPFPLLHMKLNK
ncbi:GNAT family N-acetyltransferase [Aliarcobacter lanthieri]|uniref:GNAT family N-acetyltransferase n=1 Tax=Arcobacteraceae TaxID=2808963 RepID=UPI000DEA5B06|nr:MULTISPECIES: GNAT family N-acetyltransferase [Arcobacteraceae]MBL3519557.1 GNAT family N-acetyltransferase [Aliarcobacter lanthieri]RBQ27020.1 GNAT family N-acetyltransferase [Arcobacter sp. CECT 9188]